MPNPYTSAEALPRAFGGDAQPTNARSRRAGPSIHRRARPGRIGLALVAAGLVMSAVTPVASAHDHGPVPLPVEPPETGDLLPDVLVSHTDVDSRTSCAIRLNKWDVPDAALTSGAAILYTECITATAKAIVDSCVLQSGRTYLCKYHYEIDLVGRGAFQWSATWYTWGDTNFDCPLRQTGQWGGGKPGLFQVVCKQEQILYTPPDDIHGCWEVWAPEMDELGSGGWTISAGGRFGNTRFEIGAIDVMVCPMVCNALP